VWGEGGGAMLPRPSPHTTKITILGPLVENRAVTEFLNLYGKMVFSLEVFVVVSYPSKTRFIYFISSRRFHATRKKQTGAGGRLLPHQ
jgi:hypothetical protein